MIDLTDTVVVPWLSHLAEWSVRWAVLIAILAIWFAVRPPRRTEVRLLLCQSVLLVGLLLQQRALVLSEAYLL